MSAPRALRSAPHAFAVRNARTAAMTSLAVAVIAATVLFVVGRDSSGHVASLSGPARWESYGNVEVQVPADWAYDGHGSRWCYNADTPRPSVSGAVRRPMASVLIGCASELPPQGLRIPVLAFAMNNEPEHRDAGNGWELRTRIIGGTAITVLSNDPQLREAILGTARPIGIEDHYGCPPDHPAAHDPSYRPTSPSVGTRSVESISICHYTNRDGTTPRPAPLIASARTTGENTQNLLTALRAAPAGSGPNDPGACAPEVSLGSHLIVLRPHNRDRPEPHDIVLRYSGCVRNGTDDGHTSRRLTRALLTAINNDPIRLDGGIKPVFDLINR